MTAIAVVLLLVAAAGAGVLWRWQQAQHSGSNNGGGNGTTADNGQADSLSQNSLPGSVQAAQDLTANGKYDQADKQIATSIATTSDNNEKYELYLAQGVNYENQRQYDNAISAYKNAEAVKKTWIVYKALGRASEGKGDKTAALSYYKQALGALDGKDPQYRSEQTEVQQYIQALGG